VLQRRAAGPTVILLAAVACWSLNFTFVKYGLTHGYSPLAFVALRWALASAVFVAICLLVEGSLALARRDLAVLAAAVTCGVFLNQIALSYGLDAAGASAIALVFGILPILTSVLAGVLGIERIGRRHWIGVAVSCGGLACVAAGAEGSAHGSVRGIGLALAAAVTFAIYAVAVFPLMARSSPVRVNAVGSLIGATLLVIASAPSIVAEDWGDVSASAWGALLASALVSLVVGNGLWLLGLSRVGPARASIFVNLQPFLGALVAAAVLSERVSALSIAGGVLLLAAVFGVVARPAAVPRRM
jgi:drug/metabolite transporter (DMT)-like permease